ncbi:MAG: hypothetical protein KC419_08960, partial [Anaerolineales bacterium]|nr:hypothetical protein [Anaerolineales bacterium]
PIHSSHPWNIPARSNIRVKPALAAKRKLLQRQCHIYTNHTIELTKLLNFPEAEKVILPEPLVQSFREVFPNCFFNRVLNLPLMANSLQSFPATLTEIIEWQIMTHSE